MLGALVLTISSVCLALTGTAGADLSSGQQLLQAASAQSPFTPNTPFASGQIITVSVPANTLFTNLESIHIVECQAAPDGSPPVGSPVCDNNTQYGNTVTPNADGSFTVTDMPVYALPSSFLGESASNATVCGGSSDPCILYIGLDQSNIAQAHVWSQGFSIVKTDSGETGTVNPGDGSIPSPASTPDPGLSKVSVNPSSVVANGVDSATVTATMLGTNAHSVTAPVPTGTPVTLTAASGSSVITALSGTTDATGTATFTVTDAAAESVTYRASALGVTVTQQPSVTFQAPVVSASASRVVANPASPTSVPADGSSISTITVTLRDQGPSASPIAGQAVTLTQDTGKHSQIQTLSGTSDPSGMATFSVTDASAEVVTYTAHAGGVAITSTASVTFGSLTPSAAASTVVAVSPATVGSGNGTTVTVTLLTTGGASPVSGKAVSLTASPAPTVSISPVAGSTSDLNGQVVFQVTDANPESVVLTAEDTTDGVTVTQAPAVVFQASQGATTSATLSSVSINPSTVVADGTTASTFFVTIRDTNNNVLAGKIVNVAPTVSDTKITVTPITPAGVNQSPGETDSTGLATFQIRGTSAEANVAFTVTDQTDSDLVIAPTVAHTVTFVAGPVDGSQSSMAASPTAVNADGTSTSTITVTLGDHFGNPVAGRTVSLIQGNGHATVQAVTPITGTDGVATFTVSDTTPEYVVFEGDDVDDGDLLVAQTVQVTFGTPPPILPDPNGSAIVANRSSVAADGKTAATVTVLLFDGNGIPVSGRAVSVRPSGGSSQVIPVNGTTDASGQATFSVTDSTAESVRYTATDTSDSVAVNGSVSVSFTAATPVSSAGNSRNKSVVNMTSTSDGGGYSLVATDGGVFTFGDTVFHGSTGNLQLNKPIVGMAATPDGGGYWLVASDGGIFTGGDAVFHGSTGNLQLNKPIVGMAATPDGGGYWLVASDGGIFTFGDAVFHGSTGNLQLNKPIVGMAATPDGGGYWLVASDGGVFTFGDAVFHGSTGNLRLNKPIVGMAATPDGGGYWLVASDGGVFTFGDAVFHGSTGNLQLNKPIVGMAATPDGGGYWLVASDGGVFTFGDAVFHGSAA